MAIAVDHQRSADELRYGDRGTITEQVVGDHRVRRVVENGGPGYCTVAFYVGQDRNVTIDVIFLDDTARACDLADRAALLVEPKLP